MDIETPMMDGVEASKRLWEIDATVMTVFVSRLQHLIGDGYAVEALDFGIKPSTYERIVPVLQRIENRYRSTPGSPIQTTKSRTAWRNPP